jgi:hypothetical protein
MVFRKEVCVFCLLETLIFKSYLYDLQVTTRYSGTCGLLRRHDAYISCHYIQAAFHSVCNKNRKFVARGLNNRQLTLHIYFNVDGRLVSCNKSVIIATTICR